MNFFVSSVLTSADEDVCTVKLDKICTPIKTLLFLRKFLLASWENLNVPGTLSIVKVYLQIP